MMQIPGLFGMYFDAAVVFVTSHLLQIGSGHIVGVKNCTLHTLKVGKSQIFFLGFNSSKK